MLHAPATNDFTRHYLVSLCSLCALQRGQYFFHSTRSGCNRLFLSVKELRFLQTSQARMIFSRAMCCSYLRILVTTHAPTVRPPSLMANRSPSSIAIGAISSIVICTLSPGI